MSFYLTSSQSKLPMTSEINLSITDAITKHRSISLTSKRSAPTSTFTSTIMQEPNKFPNMKTFSHNHKSKNIPNCYATLPKVSIDLNETLTIKEEHISDLRNKLKELSSDKIKLINKSYIKELKILRDTIDNILSNKQSHKKQ